MVANGSAAAVSATHVSFRHKGASAGYALDDLELEVPAGEVVVLCGRSGCGKTTVTRLLNGLIPQFYEGDLWGRADVLGVDPSVEPITRLATLVGSVFQNPRSQFFNVDTTSELAFGCENMGWAPTLIDAAMAGVVVRFGLEDLLDRNLFKLSGGEKQKIACASVSAHDPQLLVLDEPASNLDVASIRMLASIVAQWKAEGRTVVVATGAEARELGVPGEAALRGRGVSYCATCDGMLYRGREVAIVGGGNTAVGDALTLARLAGRVTLIHRRDALRASAVYLDKLRENGVNIVWNTEVKALQGDDRLTGLVLRNKVTGEESTLPVDGLFVAVGRRPETALFRGQLETDEAGYLIADETTRTSLPGVYAVGDVRRKPVRQILTAAADGAVAAHYIEEYLAGNRA